MPIVLASTSPRRQELLKNAGLEFVVKPANIPEVRHEGEPPQAFAERMAKEKAGAIWAGAKNECVLAADTIVVVDDLVLGKPEDEADATRMLRSEEHTSELQSPCNLVCRLLLEKKNVLLSAETNYS